MLWIPHCVDNLLTVNCEIEREREREREKVRGGGSERHYNRGGNNICGLKVPRHCPLVLLIGVGREFMINSTFLILELLKLEGLH
jgi:hypothetical protein